MQRRNFRVALDEMYSFGVDDESVGPREPLGDEGETVIAEANTVRLPIFKFYRRGQLQTTPTLCWHQLRDDEAGQSDVSYHVTGLQDNALDWQDWLTLRALERLTWQGGMRHELSVTLTQIYVARPNIVAQPGTCLSLSRAGYSGRDSRLMKNSLLRLAQVRLLSRGIWYDSASNSYVDGNVHILESVQTPTGKLCGRTITIRWSDQYFSNLECGHVHQYGRRRLLGLSSGVCQRAYEVLSYLKRSWEVSGKPRFFPIRLSDIVSLVGLSLMRRGAWHVANLRVTLDESLASLHRNGLLQGWEYYSPPGDLKNRLILLQFS